MDDYDEYGQDENDLDTWEENQVALDNEGADDDYDDDSDCCDDD